MAPLAIGELTGVTWLPPRACSMNWWRLASSAMWRPTAVARLVGSAWVRAASRTITRAIGPTCVASARSMRASSAGSQPAVPIELPLAPDDSAASRAGGGVVSFGEATLGDTALVVTGCSPSRGIGRMTVALAPAVAGVRDSACSAARIASASG